MDTDILKRIHVNPKVLCGKPIIRDTRISVELILEKLASGSSFSEIIYDYDIAEDDIKAAIAYAYEIIANEDVIEVAYGK
jgi:uncharacterized protein (DUF433 family)